MDLVTATIMNLQQLASVVELDLRTEQSAWPYVRTEGGGATLLDIGLRRWQGTVFYSVDIQFKTPLPLPIAELATERLDLVLLAYGKNGKEESTKLNSSLEGRFTLRKNDVYKLRLYVEL